jgi:hypothetical protein
MNRGSVDCGRIIRTGATLPGRMGRALAAVAIACSVSLTAVRAMPQGAGESVDRGRPPDPKCGLASRLLELGLASKEELPSAMAAQATPAVLQAERIIGAFRFHYDTTGTDSPAMLNGSGDRVPGSYEEFVDSAGAVLNYVYTYETGVLGYLDPIQPGQEYYDIYIFNSTYYGETVPEARIGSTTPARYTTHMNIDNDFQYFYSPGMSGLRVTAAHEFFHAIQFASYGYWSTDNYFMEISSTWMEGVVYGGIKDYYQYIRGPLGPGGYAPRGQFAQPDFSLLKTDGLIEYSRAILGKFIEKQYSRDVMKRAWELVTGEIAIDALDGALGERGSSFREAFLLWSGWNARTGPDADTAAYYTDGREYPRIVTAPVVDYVAPGRTIADTINTTSVSYHPVTVGSGAMSVIVANLRTSGAAAPAAFRYEMADAGDATFKKLSNGLYVRLDVPDPSNWATIETAPQIIASVTPAPNPFVVGHSRALDFYIPAPLRPEAATLAVLNVGLDRVFYGPLGIRDDLATAFIQVAEWDARGASGDPLPSGIYIYVLTVDGTEYTGKFSVVR